MEQKEEFLQLRDKFLEFKFGSLNNMQQKAAFTTEGPELIIAGAGSGKTTVIISRIANLILYGNAYGTANLTREVTEQDVESIKNVLDGKGKVQKELASLIAYNPIQPEHILAITFTNKAAGELKTRISRMLGEEQGSKVFASTFHSMCAKFLREDSDKIGYPKSFAIYDADDSKSLMKHIYKDNNISDKEFPRVSILNYISHWKDNMQTPDDVNKGFFDDEIERTAAELYEDYQTRLEDAGAMDFDDLIFNMVLLLQKYPAVRKKYTDQFQYLMVDEYQDTSKAQFELVRLLTGPQDNICVVGDDDQSIYSFRGATVENILGFTNIWPKAKVVKLEQNYRSTGNILAAANSVIHNNYNRQDKTLWTAQDSGEKVQYHTYNSDREEAYGVISKIRRNVQNGIPLKQQCILYRKNALSRQFETALIAEHIPYKIVGGLRFYERAEVKDVLAYLTVIDNPKDDLRLRRIINVPPRKIGASTIDKIVAEAKASGTSMLDVILNLSNHPSIKKTPALESFGKLYEKMSQQTDSGKLTELTKQIVELSEYNAYLEKDTESGSDKKANIVELISAINEYELREKENATLSGFLEEVALISDMDSLNKSENAVTLMTMHSAKGLEYSVVYGVGLEDGIMPCMMQMMDASEMEEERRLFYVMITRAKKLLYLSSTRQRFSFKRVVNNKPSPFLKEIDQDTLSFDAKSNIFAQEQTDGWDNGSTAWSEGRLF